MIVGAFVFGCMLLLFVLVAAGRLVVIVPLEGGRGPGVGAGAGLFADLRIHAVFVFQLHFTIGGDVDIDGLFENDVGLVELVLGPELSGGGGGVDHRAHVVFENVAGAKSGNRDVLLAEVGVDRSFVLDGSAEILHGIIAGFDHGAVGLKHAHVGNLDSLVGRVVAHLQLSPLLYSRLALHADAGDEFFAARAVGLEAVVGVEFFDDERLLRVVVAFVDDHRGLANCGCRLIASLGGFRGRAGGFG